MTSTIPTKPHIQKLFRKFQSPPEKYKIKRNALGNWLNLLNFRRHQLKLVFLSPDDQKTIELDAIPQPFEYERLTCSWNGSVPAVTDLQDFQFNHLLIPTRDYSIAVKPAITEFNSEYIQFDIGSDLDYDKIYHSVCQASIKQGETEVEGQLVGFDLKMLQLVFDESTLSRLQQINPEYGFQISVIRDEKNVYESTFKLVDVFPYQTSVLIRFEPSQNLSPLMQPKKHRSSRVALKPMPEIFFNHPFHGRPVRMNVIDLSGSGILTETDQPEASLFAGLVLHNIEIVFPGNVRMVCTAQVVHRKIIQSDEIGTKALYGFSFLKMAGNSHTALQSIVQQTESPDVRTCEKIEMDELWSFFFETGFVSPDKYQLMHHKKAIVEETYKKLYQNSSNIARHFIYQKSGRIIGHLSMLRFNSRAWMLHHHTALKSDLIKAGVVVLEQASQFIYNSRWNNECKMDYLTCYFRPEDALPAYFFGGYATSVKNKKCCSTDTFTFHHFLEADLTQELPKNWALQKLVDSDLPLLKDFYELKSGGLFLKAFDLDEASDAAGELEAEFKKEGLKKERYTYSLKKSGDLKAVVIVNVSDDLINMSDLVNCISLIVLDEMEVNQEIIGAVFKKLAHHYHDESFSALIYPENIAEQHGMPIQKKYLLWIADSECSDPYFDYINNIIEQISQT